MSSAVTAAQLPPVTPAPQLPITAREKSTSATLNYRKEASNPFPAEQDESMRGPFGGIFRKFASLREHRAN